MVCSRGIGTDLPSEQPPSMSSNRAQVVPELYLCMFFICPEATGFGSCVNGRWSFREDGIMTLNLRW